jgi:hypothetical protein
MCWWGPLLAGLLRSRAEPGETSDRQASMPKVLVPCKLQSSFIEVSTSLIALSHTTRTMICRNCIRRAARSFLSTHPSSSSRSLSHAAPRLNATPINPQVATQSSPQKGSSSSSHTPSAATSTSAAQPFSEPLTPSPKGDPVKEKEKAHPLVKSSIPAGTPLRGLNFLKNQSDPIAMEDSEYPSWLWEILQKQEKKAEAGAAGDLFCMPPSPFFAASSQDTR